MKGGRVPKGVSIKMIVTECDSKSKVGALISRCVDTLCLIILLSKKGLNAVKTGGSF